MTRRSRLAFVPKELPYRPKTPNNLPADRALLVGREQETEAVCRLLSARGSTGLTELQGDESRVRLLTLVGPGGVGKTSLALAVAGRLLEAFEHGVFLVDLVSILEIELVLTTMAAAVQAPVNMGEPLSSALRRLYWLLSSTRPRRSNIACQPVSLIGLAGAKRLESRCPIPGSAFYERFLGSVRRECLDYVLTLGEMHLHGVVKEYVRHYNSARPHQGIGQVVPDRTRSPVQEAPLTGYRTEAKVVSFPVLGGLHHDYRRVA